MTPALLLAAVASVAQPAPDDVELRALTDELHRFQSLSATGLDRPYHLTAYVDDSTSFHVAAAFGALSSRNDGTHRTVSVIARVGSPELDDSGYLDRETMMSQMLVRFSGVGATPVEADYDALRQSLWLQFDSTFKGAVETLSRKRAFLQTNEVPNRPLDFAPAAVTTVIEPRTKLAVDRARWTKLVKSASALFRGDDRIQDGSADFSAALASQSMVSSDPVQQRISDTSFELTLTATAQAADGMEVVARYAIQRRSESDLPSDAEVLQAARDVVQRLNALVAAPPLADDYEGPVLLTGRAAARFFLNAVGTPLSGPRETLGLPHRARLVDRLGKHIASSLITVRDDPTQRAWHGQSLEGWFPVDDEGVVPQPITLIESGVLKTYYMSRTPTLHVKESNGHARAQQGMVGSMFVDSSGGKTRAELKQALIELVKTSDQPFGLLIDDLSEEPGGGLPFQMAGLMFGRGGGGDINLPTPTMIYRVYPDGREELIRGARFKPASFRILSDIVAIGSEQALLNTEVQGQGVSVVAPAVLLRVLELSKPQQETEKLPTLPRPPLP